MKVQAPQKKKKSAQLDEVTNMVLAIGIVGTAWLCTAGMIMLYFHGKQTPGEFVAVTGTVYGTLGTAYYGARRREDAEQSQQQTAPKPEET